MSVRCCLHAVGVVFALAVAGGVRAESARVPAVPLVTHDPYFSIWSGTDALTDDWARHWTGKIHAMCSMVRVDGKTFRLMGRDPGKAPALKQTSVAVHPTRTIYQFAGEGVRVQLTFTSPVMADDADLVSRPVTYLAWDVSAEDGKAHEVSVYFDASSELAVDVPEQSVTWSRLKAHPLTVLQIGTRDQAVLAKRGDDVRIDWGHLYVAAPSADLTDSVISGARGRGRFMDQGTLRETDDMRMPRAVSDEWPVLALSWNMGSVSGTTVSRHALLAYDDEYSLEFLNRRLRPYWRRNGMDALTLLNTAEKEYEALAKRCASYDAELTADLVTVGREDFANLAVLSYRQCLAAHKLAADFDGTPIMLSKENFSNGCIGTVDVLYPAAPFFYVFNTELLKAQIRPLLIYGASSRWKWPFAPHDLGTYPLANGQAYGGGERTEEDQMPVEESGNMLILLAALAQRDGNADFVRPYWGLMKKWGEYLAQKGLDPENQLCTDDFAGHLAHNANLSIKAILGIGSYGILCEQAGEKEEAQKYKSLAKSMAAEWIKKAKDGDHYRLAFDKPGTWSQKYNLVWDKLLGLNLFPAEVASTEIAYYKTKMQDYGLPLDSRMTYTKLDWTVWTACLTESPADFQLFMKPIAKFIRETPDRVPLTDWYETANGKKVGFQARSVVGGVYLPVMYHKDLWDKWSKKAQSSGK